MKKLISTLLCICLLLTLLPILPFYFDLETSALEMFPSIITEEQLQYNTFVKRLAKFDEYLNTIGYKNDDGTETAFIYSHDVKYIDENGNIKDKDISIIEDKSFIENSKYSYRTKSNDVVMYLPEKLTKNNWVKLSFKDYEIKMNPSVLCHNLESDTIRRINQSTITYTAKETTNENSSKTSANIPVANKNEAIKNNIMQFDKVFDNNTHIRIESTYQGLKEDIILDKYTGTNKFSFIMDVGKLVVQEYNGGARIYDGQKIVAEIPPIYVEDSLGNFTLENNMVVTLKTDGTYEITVIVDSDFLTSENTVYPVMVDPSINFSPSSQNDATVFENRPDANYGNQIKNFVGGNSSYGSAWFYVKFDISSLQGIRYDNILSAYYHCQEQTHQVANSVVEVFLPFDDWNEDDITWNNKPNHNSHKICAMNINGNQKSSYDNHWYNFYITSAIMAWQQGVPNYGLAFKEHTNSYWKTFGASEGDSTYPYMRVTYTNEPEVASGLGLVDGKQYYIKNKRSNKYLTTSGASNESNVYQANFTGSSAQKWTLDYLDNGYYRVTPANSPERALDVYGGSSSPSGNTNEANIQIYIYSGGTNQQWKIVRNWNGTYRFLSRNSGTNRAMVVDRALYESGANIFQYTYSSDYMYNDDWTLEPVDLGFADFYNFTNSGGYGINTTTNVNQAVSLASNIGFYATNIVNEHASLAYNYITLDGLLYFIGHGYRGGMVFNSQVDNQWVRSDIVAAGTGNSDNTYYINQLAPNSLKKLNVAVISSCRTGEDNTNYENSNMVGYLYKRGAHFATAHTHLTFVNNHAEWLLQFMTALNNGKCLYDAMELADEYIYSISNSTNGEMFGGNVNQRHVLGDTSLTLKH